MLNNYKINKLVLVDYEGILKLTNKYLKKVLKKNDYKKIIFCNFENFQFTKNFFLENYKINNFDLLFNSDSFHEIENKIIYKYLKYFSKICDNFFIKNAIAKYRIKDVSNHLSKKRVPKSNIKLGLSNKVINIFDNKKINVQYKEYLRKYNPYKKIYTYQYQLSEIYPTCLLALFSKTKK